MGANFYLLLPFAVKPILFGTGVKNISFKGGPKKCNFLLPFEEISVLPDLVSPPHFRIQGGPLRVTDGRIDNGQTSLY